MALVKIKTKSGIPVTVDSEAAESYQGFLNELEDSGYKIKSLGGYNPRYIDGTRTPSEHAKGRAIDVNDQDNPVQYRAFLGNKPFKTDLPENVGEIAERWGLKQGIWNNKIDPMHFEYTGKKVAQTKSKTSDLDIDGLAKEFGGGGTDNNSTIDTNVSKPSPSNLDIDGLAKEFGGEAKTSSSNPAPKEQKWWQGLNNDPTWSGLAKRIGISAGRGVLDVVDTVGRGTDYLSQKTADALSYVTGNQNISKEQEEFLKNTNNRTKQNRNEYDKEYGDNTPMQIGRIGGQVAVTAPLVPARAFQAVDAALGAAPIAGKAAPLINRLISSSVKGASGGSVLNAATSAQNDKSLAENVGEGAITGAVGGPVITGAANVAGKIGRKILGGVSGTTAKLAERAEQLGIPLGGAQISNSPLLKKFDQVSGWAPFSGAQAFKEKQTSAFTRAVSRTFGEDVDEITPQVISKARQKIGGEIENVAQSSTIKADTDLGKDLTKIWKDANGLTDEELRPISRQIQNVINMIDANGNIAGKDYNDFVKYKGVLSKMQNNSNPNIRNVANEIREALDNALTRNVTPDKVQDLLAARAKYKSVMTIKKLAEADEHGQVSPLRLMQKVMQAPGGKLGAGDLGELADIGRAFFKQPSDSGTPLGEVIVNKLGPSVASPVSALVAGVTTALTSATPYLHTLEGAFGLGANRFLRKGLNSNATREALIRSGKGQTHGTINKLSNAVVPYTAALSPPRNPLKKNSE